MAYGPFSLCISQISSMDPKSHATFTHINYEEFNVWNQIMTTEKEDTIKKNSREQLGSYKREEKGYFFLKKILPPPLPCHKIASLYISFGP